MIHIHTLPDEAAKAAMESGEFPPEIISGARVAVVMTQSWCPEWLRMRSWLTGFERQGKPADREIDVHVLVYDKVDYFQQFRSHKETVFGNDQIPYIRYYERGTLTGESNYVHRGGFLERFPQEE